MFSSLRSLPFRPLARLAQDEESGSSGVEAGSGGGLGALIAPAGTFSAASHKTSTSRSPAFASSMIALAMFSSLRSRGHLIAARAISNATPRRRVVSGSKVWPLKKGLMGTRAFPPRHAEPITSRRSPVSLLSAVKPKSELNRHSRVSLGRLSKKLHSLPSSIRRIIQPRGWWVLTFSAGGDGGTGLKSAALDGGCRAAPSAPIVLGWSMEQIPLGCSDPRDLLSANGTGGCSSAILIAVGCSSGMSPIFPQVDWSRTLRSEPFSSCLVTDQRSKNSCV
jgi:hypothetical protein